MAARRGVFGRLVDLARNGFQPRTPSDPPATSDLTTPEDRVAAYLSEASAAMRARRFHSWLARLEPFPGGMEMFAEPALQVACLRAALDRPDHRERGFSVITGAPATGSSFGIGTGHPTNVKSTRGNRYSVAPRRLLTVAEATGVGAAC